MWESVPSDLIPSRQLWARVWTHLRHRHQRPIEASRTYLGSNRSKAQITFKQKFPRRIIWLNGCCLREQQGAATTAGKMDGAPSDSHSRGYKANCRFVLCQGRRQLFVSTLSVFSWFQHLITCTISAKLCNSCSPSVNSPWSCVSVSSKFEIL